mmetsp:Transcript_1060/g.2592  ORF Transcript_1060/g.2592 Transcript_1060/m.2592 type:complete len:411 (+) Transcript_1060:1078-2310(+)
MVMDYGLTAVRSSTGYYSGILGASYMIGRGISAPFWGTFMDKHGRRPTIIVSLTALFLGSLIFGFSPNYAFANGIRFVTGLFSPYSGVCKAAVSEICPKDKRPYCMSIFSVGWYLGLIAGTAAGGTLVYPVPESTEAVNATLLEHFPMLLLNLLSAGISFCALILAVLYFRETLGQPLNELELSESPIQESSVSKILFLYSLQSISQTVFAEVLPLWCWADKANGGLNYQINQIGLVLTCSYLALIVVQRPLYEQLVLRNGIRWILIVSLAVAIPLVILLPFQSMLITHKTVLWCSLVLVCNLYNLLNFQIFNAQNLLINNSVIQTSRGKLNGVAMSISSFCKAIGPLIGGVLFAFTSTHDWAYPFNFSFVFNILGLMFAIQLLVTRRLPSSIEDAIEKRDLSKPSVIMA